MRVNTGGGGRYGLVSRSSVTTRYYNENTQKLALGLTLGASAALAGQAANAESVLRVGMTAGDIPIVLGQPDQGFEGYRFVGYNLYDPLSFGTCRERTRRPTLSFYHFWKIDPNDNKRWLITLRKALSGTMGAIFVPEDVVWNLDRIANKDAPQFNVKQFGMIRNRTGNIDKVEVLGDHEIAIVTKTPDALFPYQLSYWFMISKCRLTETQ